MLKIAFQREWILKFPWGGGACPQTPLGLVQLSDICLICCESLATALLINKKAFSHLQPRWQGREGELDPSPV